MKSLTYLCLTTSSLCSVSQSIESPFFLLSGIEISQSLGEKSVASFRCNMWRDSFVATYMKTVQISGETLKESNWRFSHVLCGGAAHLMSGIEVDDSIDLLQVDAVTQRSNLTADHSFDLFQLTSRLRTECMAHSMSLTQSSADVQAMLSVCGVSRVVPAQITQANYNPDYPLMSQCKIVDSADPWSSLTIEISTMRSTGTLQPKASRLICGGVDVGIIGQTSVAEWSQEVKASRSHFGNKCSELARKINIRALCDSHSEAMMTSMYAYRSTLGAHGSLVTYNEMVKNVEKYKKDFYGSCHIGLMDDTDDSHWIRVTKSPKGKLFLSSIKCAGSIVKAEDISRETMTRLKAFVSTAASFSQRHLTGVGSSESPAWCLALSPGFLSFISIKQICDDVRPIRSPTRISDYGAVF